MWRFIDERKKEKFLDILEQNLKNIDLSAHPEKLLDSLTSVTKASIEKCFPLKQMSNRAKKRSLIPWYGSEIFKDEKTQSKLFRRFVKSNKPEDHRAYSTFRNNLSKKKYRAKRQYFQDLLGDAKKNGDKSMTWEVINRAFGKNKKARVYPEKVRTGGTDENPSMSQCPVDVANALNKHFSSVAEKLAKKLKKTKTSYTKFIGKRNESCMYLRNITLDEIIEEIKRICVRKSMGNDGIPPKVIKWAPHLLAPILLVIFNKCIDLGYYPNSMKVAKVAPVHKDGDKNNLNN